MIAALLIGREGSVGYPGKNVSRVLGRPLMSYPLLAAQGSPLVDQVFVSTDSLRIKGIARNYGATILDRPDTLATPEALGEDVFVHGYQCIQQQVRLDGHDLELLVLLCCNAATVTADLIDRGIGMLRENPSYDSAVSVSQYNMWSPLRARKIGDDGLLHPFVPFETFGDPATLTCDRDSQGPVYFADMGVMVVRPRCFDGLAHGLLPQRWMGQHIYPLIQWGGLDVDYAWQVPQVEYWLRQHGWETA